MCTRGAFQYKLQSYLDIRLTQTEFMRVSKCAALLSSPICLLASASASYLYFESNLMFNLSLRRQMAHRVFDLTFAPSPGPLVPFIVHS